MVRHNSYGSEADLSVTYTFTEESINSNLEVYIEKDTQRLVVTWEGDVSSHEIRQGYAEIIELVRTHKPVRWLLDLNKRGALKRADQRWVFTHFFPEALRLVQQDIFVAIILPVHAFPVIISELEGDELMHGDNFLIIDHFLYKEEAVRWLEERSGIREGA